MAVLRVPVSWLLEYVHTQTGFVGETGIRSDTRRTHTDCPVAEDILESLLSVGFEGEILDRPELSGPIVVGRVLDFTEEVHSNGKTIRWCKVRVCAPVQPNNTPLSKDCNPSTQTGNFSNSDTNSALETRDIVCGASNFSKGDLVVVTLPGSNLPGGFHVTARKVYGHLSDGMIASEKELGVGDNHDGILRLAEVFQGDELSKIREGDNALDLLALTDSAVAVSITPDRGYAMSIRGIAREYALATNIPFSDPLPDDVLPAGGLSIDLWCKPNAFFTLLIQEIENNQTPQWMVRRLQLAGIRSVCLVVDITNYVMVETGQPLHAYDYDAIQGPLCVRTAGKKETLDTIDGRRLELHTDDLVVADANGALSLAGVIGGSRSRVTSDTKRILLEAGNFNPIDISLSSRRHKLYTEASARFARSVDILIAQRALARAAELIRDLVSGDITELGSAYINYTQQSPILLSTLDIERVVGCCFTREEIMSSLRAIGCDVSCDSDHSTPDTQVMLVTPPSFRPDLVNVQDLAEEVIRVIGFNRIPSLRLSVPHREQPVQSQQYKLENGKLENGYTLSPVTPPRTPPVTFEQRRLLGQSLAACGHVEVICYPFVNLAAAGICHIDVTHNPDSGSDPIIPTGVTRITEPGSSGVSGPDNVDVKEKCSADTSVEHPTTRAISLHNPIDATEGYLRRSLIPGLLQCAHRNLSRGLCDLSIFEIGRVFLGQLRTSNLIGCNSDSTCNACSRKNTIESMNEVYQPYTVSVLQTGSAIQKQPYTEGRKYDLADVFDSARQIARGLGVDFHFVQDKHPAFHPGRCAKVICKHHHIGYTGQILPTLANKHNLPDNVFACEINLDLVAQLGCSQEIVKTLPTSPAATQHLTLTLGNNIAAASVISVVKEGAGELLEDIRLIDEYKHEESDKKSLTFAMRFRDKEKTLTAQRVNLAKENAVRLASSKFGAIMRR